MVATNRRGFLTLLGGAAAATALPPTALAQQPNEIFAVTATEGGHWIPWTAWQEINYCGLEPAAILYPDGRIWDNVIDIWRGDGYWAKDTGRVNQLWDRPEIRIKARLEYGYKV